LPTKDNEASSFHGGLSDGVPWLYKLKRKEFDRIARSLKKMLPDEDRITLEKHSRPTRHVQARYDGSAVPLYDLSAGYRSVVSLVLDIMSVLLFRWGAMESAERVRPELRAAAAGCARRAHSSPLRADAQPIKRAGKRRRSGTFTISLMNHGKEAGWLLPSRRAAPSPPAPLPRWGEGGRGNSARAASGGKDPSPLHRREIVFGKAAFPQRRREPVGGLLRGENVGWSHP
jgi:hypothetical protein